MSPIASFTGECAFLSNFHPVPIRFMGLDWPTVEHAYQAQKTTEKPLQEHIRNLPSAGAAKRAGRVVPLRYRWDIIKAPIMRQLVRCKFMQHPVLAHALLGTGSEELIEGNSWHDNFFGDCTCVACANVVGLNWLGILLMEVRQELRDMGCR
jgi:ribA/ribD-fused uncharacterized protein